MPRNDIFSGISSPFFFFLSGFLFSHAIIRPNFIYIYIYLHDRFEGSLINL